MRPEISLMGVESGENYLREFINQQSEYIDLLEDTVQYLVISEGMHIPKNLEHLFK